MTAVIDQIKALDEERGRDLESLRKWHDEHKDKWDASCEEEFSTRTAKLDDLNTRYDRASAIKKLEAKIEDRPFAGKAVPNDIPDVRGTGQEPAIDPSIPDSAINASEGAE